MVYAPHSRLTFAGVFGTKAAPLERWSFRLNMNPVTAAPLPAAVQEAVTAWTTHMASLSRAVCRLTEVKFARLDVNGRYTEDPVIVETDVAASGAGGTDWPFQIAAVATLETARRGPTGRGRLYLPLPAVPVAGDGRISIPNAQLLQTGVKNFLGALNAIGAFDLVCVASSKGYNTTVDGVTVGRVLDTVRSRRTSLPEDYVVEAAVSQTNA